MSTFDSPIAIRSFNEKYKNRNRKRIYVTPLSDLSVEDRTLVDVVFNNSLTTNNVLPKDVEEKLRRIEGNSYQVSYHKSNNMYKVRILIDTTDSSIRILIDTDGSYEYREYKTVAISVVPAYIDTPLTKEEYLLGATRLLGSDTIQYNENLAESYKVLFKILFFVDLEKLVDDKDTVRLYLESLLRDSEVTLHLTPNKTIMLYGTVDSDAVVVLHVREISTPDTYYTRTFALGSMYV